MSLRCTEAGAELTIATPAPAFHRRLYQESSTVSSAPTPRTATVDGCGLGLSIAQWIVSAHRGSIQIVSSQQSQQSSPSACRSKRRRFNPHEVQARFHLSPSTLYPALQGLLREKLSFLMRKMLAERRTIL